MDRVAQDIDRRISAGELERLPADDDGVIHYRMTEVGKMRVDCTLAHESMKRARVALEQANALLEWVDNVMHTEPPLMTLEQTRKVVEAGLPEEKPEERPAPGQYL
jgi:hypothetical protein